MSRKKAAVGCETGSNYFDIPIDRPPASPYGAYTINDTSVGALDKRGGIKLPRQDGLI